MIPFYFPAVWNISYCLYVSPYLSFFTVWSGLASDRKPQDSSFRGKKKCIGGGNNWDVPTQYNSILLHFRYLTTSQYRALFGFHYQAPVFSIEKELSLLSRIKPPFSQNPTCLVLLLHLPPSEEKSHQWRHWSLQFQHSVCLAADLLCQLLDHPPRNFLDAKKTLLLLFQNSASEQLVGGRMVQPNGRVVQTGPAELAKLAGHGTDPARKLGRRSEYVERSADISKKNINLKEGEEDV